MSVSPRKEHRMKDLRWEKKVLVIKKVLFIVAGEYMREIFAYLHTIIASMPPKLFSFIMIVLVIWLYEMYFDNDN